MTESEWLQATDPAGMVQFLREDRTSFRTRWLGWVFPRRFRINERKWRLFYVACCRRILHVMPAEESRILVEIVERRADGQASEEEVVAGIEASMQACRADSRWRQEAGSDWSWAEAEAVNAVGRVHRSEETGRFGTLRGAACAWACSEDPGGIRLLPVPPGEANVQMDASWQAEYDAESARQAGLLREIVGNPFRKSLVDPAWLTWQGGTIQRIAQSVYEERRFEGLPILADALEDAGCTNAAILDHCRSAGAHVRGCWVVDKLREKE